MLLSRGCLELRPQSSRRWPVAVPELWSTATADWLQKVRPWENCEMECFTQSHMILQDKNCQNMSTLIVKFAFLQFTLQNLQLWLLTRQEALQKSTVPRAAERESHSKNQHLHPKGPGALLEPYWNPIGAYRNLIGALSLWRTLGLPTIIFDRKSIVDQHHGALGPSADRFQQGCALDALERQRRSNSEIEASYKQ